MNLLLASPARRATGNFPSIPVPAEAIPNHPPRPLMDHWFLSWAERAEARWRAVDSHTRYY